MIKQIPNIIQPFKNTRYQIHDSSVKVYGKYWYKTQNNTKLYFEIYSLWIKPNISDTRYMQSAKCVLVDNRYIEKMLISNLTEMNELCWKVIWEITFKKAPCLSWKNGIFIFYTTSTKDSRIINRKYMVPLLKICIKRIGQQIKI